MPTNGQRQSPPDKDVHKGRAEDATRLPRGPRLLTAAQWLAYFRANSAHRGHLPWERGAEVTPEELGAIARSLQAWQLAETSDGRHLRAAAARYAEQVGDPDYPLAVELFIREEQRHGEMLGRFLDLSGAGCVKADWGDRLFRAARYCVTDMEVWTTPVVMVETLALVYYNAVRRATRSPLLRAICGQILADEVPHLRFQCERLATLFRRRGRLAFRLTMLAHRLCFLGILALVWVGHRRALRAGGYGWRRYWRAAWDRMSAAWRLMDPRAYAFAPQESGTSLDLVPAREQAPGRARSTARRQPQESGLASLTR